MSLGAVALRPAPFRLAGIFQVDDYGADPTGVADSTAAVTAAIAAAHAAGGAGCAIWFTPGKTYAMNLTIDGIDGVCLLGYGVSLKSFSVANLDVLLIKGTSHTTDRFTMQGDWHIAGPASGTGSCIHFNIATNSAPSSIENVVMAGGAHGLFSDSSTAALVCRNIQVTGTGAEGILISGAWSGAGASGNCWIQGCQITAPGQIGYRVRGGIGHGLVQADIENCSQCIVVDPTASPGASQIYFSNVTVASATAGDGIRLGGGGGTLIDCSLTNIQSSANSANGIAVAGGAKNIHIANAQIVSNAQGINIIDSAANGTSDIHVTGATIIGAVRPLAAAGSGIDISAAATDIFVSDCYIDNCVLGIGVGSVATDYYFFTACSVHGNTTPIIDSGTGTHKEFGTHNAAQPGTNL